MARPRAFDEDQVLDAAIDVFREHGFEGTSAEMLVRALRIGRQSLYDTFGDKWRLYLSSVRRYTAAEAHVQDDRDHSHGGQPPRDRPVPPGQTSFDPGYPSMCHRLCPHFCESMTSEISGSPL